MKIRIGPVAGNKRIICFGLENKDHSPVDFRPKYKKYWSFGFKFPFIDAFLQCDVNGHLFENWSRLIK